MNYHLTFSSTAPHRKILPRHLAFALFTAALAGVGMFLGTSVLEWNYLLVQLLCTAGVLLLDFIINGVWTFADTDATDVPTMNVVPEKSP